MGLSLPLAFSDALSLFALCALFFVFCCVIVCLAGAGFAIAWLIRGYSERRELAHKMQTDGPFQPRISFLAILALALAVLTLPWATVRIHALLPMLTSLLPIPFGAVAMARVSASNGQSWGAAPPAAAVALGFLWYIPAFFWAIGFLLS